ncbi:vacuolar protein sorting-associated protein 37A-like [Daphnia pulex]|uniref:vacuolar protein sorting-associated protein 37A-like n=1 Tax=Daphnia pulex TaxID=6669 RepID=UPI001EDFB2D0|nr:vacuolar protein sorting-associated protein 37A-like [Daphnia pulex]XP_046440444.1 vacuolar protein sorting-associated protein 37A-like [Daphnia pulex]XP_046440445.1 vacuolar protein sorting-associated protein 37A-like [Daphnia pulex]XP_046440446.1 vacuolar protein sorting-associated protein 37A-like [Daphnia pulex]XP_046440447.1 vacuolar protein sorting-associated protein 37A-like [Daphnia pulex]XP_046654858.1 vacuolar protein sorting-associated protein 37A-like [Daphnia pulicaria]XP_0466
MNQSTVYPLNPSIVHLKKKKQIDSLRVFIEDVQEIHPGEYHVLFHSGNRELTIKIQLPPDFPTQKPLIWISPAIQHNWVTDNGRIMSPGLVNYSEHSDLGQIVNAIIRELKKLPEIKTFPNGQNGVSSNRETFLSASQFSQQQYFPIPPFIPELESLSRNQIKNLSENEDVLHQFVEELPQAEAASKDVQNHMDNVEKIARSVSDLKETWNVKRQKILEHYEMLNKLKQDWDSLNTQHHNLSQRYIPNNIEASLKQAASLADEKSEEIAEVFLSGQMDVDAFLSSYTASRTESHIRKTKEEILHKQLQELQRLGY